MLNLIFYLLSNIFSYRELKAFLRRLWERLGRLQSLNADTADALHEINEVNVQLEQAEVDRRFMFGARHHVGFKTPIDSPYSPPQVPKSTTNPNSTNKRKKTKDSDKENTVNNSVKKVRDVLMEDSDDGYSTDDIINS